MQEKSSKNKILSKILIASVLSLAAITLFITAVFLYRINRDFAMGEGKSVDWETTSYLATFFGGVIGTLFSSMGFVLIYLSFQSQTESQKDQKQQFLESQIETRFIELIKLHKENLNSLSFEGENGQKVVDKIISQFESCYKEIKTFFDAKTVEEIYKTEYLRQGKIILGSRTEIDLKQFANIDVAYSIVFYGTSEDDLKSLRKLLKLNYKDLFIENILNYISLKGKEADTLNKWIAIQKANPTADDINLLLGLLTNGISSENMFKSILEQKLEELLRIDKINKFYGGHQYKLGHYFRHLFQTVKYINENENLDYMQKYAYIKMLRAQISTIEQYLIFYNSLSFMGRAWELQHSKKDMNAQEINCCLFTKYNLIKNTPDPLQCGDINLKDYYPHISYEFDFEPVERKDYEQYFI